MLTYVYALVRADEPPQLRSMPAPMPGGEPARLLPAAQGLWLAVSTVPEQDYQESALEAGLHNLEWLGPRAIAHEAVVEHFLPCAAVLPMKLFTLFKSDERAVEHVARTHEKIEGILERIERHVEWGLRLTWVEQAALQAAQRRHDQVPVASGAAYLARKRDLLDASRSQWTAAQACAERLYRTMGQQAAAARRRTDKAEAVPHSRVLLDAAFLVRCENADAFRGMVTSQTAGVQFGPRCFYRVRIAPGAARFPHGGHAPGHYRPDSRHRRQGGNQRYAVFAYRHDGFNGDDRPDASRACRPA